MALDVDVARRLFTVEEYHRMGEAGILGEDERVELIEGEIVQMAPIYRGPAADAYADMMQHGAGRRVAPLAFPDVSFAVSDFFT